MTATRRGFLGAMLAACAAPAYIKAGILMPVRELIVPPGLGESLSSPISFAGMGSEGIVTYMPGEIGEYESTRFIVEGEAPGTQIIESRTLSLADIAALVATMKRRESRAPYPVFMHPTIADELRAALGPTTGRRRRK